ncbi:MAG: two component transcriptional regulator, LuxR family [Xanthobacteraceae bacterium]|jgi:DNA-binding NarL/FixJ family response regulator|nr:two component transcriptional regulator, LuxR family [Xanthobacteraceae bacterium]
MSTNKQESTRELHILLIDDFALRRASLKKFLESWASEAHFALDTLDHIPIYELDEIAADICLVVMNVGASSVEDPAMQGQLEELRQRMPDTPLVIMSDRDGSGDVIATLRAGARGFISSRMDPHVMLRALDFIIGGGVFFPPDALLEVSDLPGLGDGRDALPLANSLSVNGLTQRQHAVLKLLQQGQSNKRIARELRMCESTVKVHVRQIMRKLGACNRTQAALCAMEMDLAANGADETVDGGLIRSIPAISVVGQA